MRIIMKRYLSLFLSLCILILTMPSISLAEYVDAPAPDAPAETTLEPTETPDATETPEPTGTPAATESPEPTGTPAATESPEPTGTPAAAALPAITNTRGVLSYSYTPPEGVTVVGQQWLKSGEDISGAADATYTLTMEDMIYKFDSMSVRLTLSDGNTVTSGGYSMNLNNQWKLSYGYLIIMGNYDHSSTDFPIDFNAAYSCVEVNIGATVTGLTLMNKTLLNHGTIYGSRLDDCTVKNSPNGVVHVPVTINGKEYSSTPDSSVKFIYGGNALAALNEWYEANNPGASAADLVWLDADNKGVTEQSTLELNNIFVFLGKLRCSIDESDALMAGDTARADVETNIDYADMSCEWLYHGEVIGAGTTVVLPELTPGATDVITFKVKLTQDLNGISVEREVTATFSGVAYDVAVDYESDNVVITPLGDVTISGVDVTVNGNRIAGTLSDGVWTVPLTSGNRYLDVAISVLGEDGAPLAGDRTLKLERPDADIYKDDFSITVTHPGPELDDVVTITCAHPDHYKDISIAGAVYAGAREIEISVKRDVDPTLYARNPGSNEKQQLISLWGDVDNTADNSVTLNVTSQHTLASGDELFWGEVLKAKASEGATITWYINGEAVSPPPALVDGKYTIPVGTNSLSILATHGSDEIGRSFTDIKSPIRVTLDYANERIYMRRDAACNKSLTLSSGSKSDEVNDTVYEVGWQLSDLGFPKAQDEVLTLNVLWDTGSINIPVTIPARFEGQAIEDTVHYASELDPDSGLWNARIATHNYIVRHSAVKVVDASGKEIICNGDGSMWTPSEPLSGGMTYRIYAQQYSIDASNGAQNAFRSDWFDTGVSFTPGEIELSTYAPLAGDTVTATISADLESQYHSGLAWQWYYVDDNGYAGRIDGATGSSFRLAPNSDYVDCRLRVEATYNGKVISRAETAAIPQPRLVITRESGGAREELEKAEDGNYIAYVGDRLKAEVVNLSQDFLNTVSGVWMWACVDKQFSMTDSLEITSDTLTSGQTIIVQCGLGSSVPTFVGKVDVCLAPAPEVTIDYENETLVAVKPDTPLLEGYKLRADISGWDDDNCLTDGENGRYVIPISCLRGSWPDESAHSVALVWGCADEPDSESTSITIPKRPGVDLLNYDTAAFSITVNNTSTSVYEFRLTDENAASQDERELATPVDVDGNVKFTGLAENKTYKLWWRKRATAGSFSSEWRGLNLEKTGSGGTVLIPSLDWTPTYDPESFHLSDNDVKPHLTFKSQSTGENVTVSSGNVKLTRADGNSFPILDAGTYRLKVELTGDFADDNCLLTDTLTLTVDPFTVDTYDIGSLPYKGAEYSAYDFAVKVKGATLTQADYDITVDDGKTLRDVGDYSAHIAFKGNYTGDIDGDVTLQIVPFTLHASASPKSREYDGTTGVECTPGWVEGYAPFDGDDVKLNLVSAVMADAHAGADKAVAVKVSLSGAAAGNYELEDSALSASVTIEPRKVTVLPETPAGFAYNGSTNVPLTGQGWTLEGALPGDDVRVDATGAIAAVSDPGAGANKAVSFTGMTLAGTGAADYAIGSVAPRTVTIARAAAPEISWPTAGSISYGQSLAESLLTGGDTHGTFAWVNPDTKPGVGEHSFAVRYTPKDEINYDYSGVALEKDVSVTVIGSAPTGTPTAAPVATPTVAPTGTPTAAPVATPTVAPTGKPTAAPVATPTVAPTGTPTAAPVATPTADPTGTPTAAPVATPTAAPTGTPTAAPVATPTVVPTGTPTAAPTDAPTTTPTAKPTVAPTTTPAATQTATPTGEPTAAPSLAPIRDEALQQYLDDMFSLVFDEDYEPVDFDLLPVLVSGEEQEGMLLICAPQEEGGEPAQRSLVLDAAQLLKLRQAMPENEMSELVFETGGAAARMDLAELTGGSMAKLMALILSGEEVTDDTLQSDWSALEDAALTEAAYERFSLEVRIAPAAREGEQGVEISVWLSCDELSLNVSGLIDSLCVVLDVSDLVTEENAASREDMYAIAWQSGEETVLLDSALILSPTVHEAGSAGPDGAPTVAGRYALTAPYAGEGTYLVVAADPG